MKLNMGGIVEGGHSYNVGLPPSSDMKPQRPARSRDARPEPLRAAQQVARTAAQEVRIIGGRWKRTPLPVPVSAGLRPTPARVRETVFNWLGQDLTGWRVLDAFAGSGALGLEAASRGAEFVCLVERDPALVRSLRAVVQRLVPPGDRSVEVLAGDALAWMGHHPARGEPHARGFDLVFLDPPFDDDAFEQALRLAASCVVTGGWVHVEAPRELGGASGDPQAQAIGGLRRVRHARAGSVHFHLFQRVDACASTDQPAP